MKLARRNLVPFLQSKALIYFPHFYPDKFYNGSQIEEKCQVNILLNHSAKIIQSFTMKQPQDLSAEPWAFLDSFPHLSPATHYLSTGWVVPLASFSQPCSQYLLPGWEFLDIFQPRLSVWTMSGYASDVSTADPSVSSYWKGAGKLLSHQIKLRIFTNRGDSRNKRELLKFVCTP